MILDPLPAHYRRIPVAALEIGQWLQGPDYGIHIPGHITAMRTIPTGRLAGFRVVAVDGDPIDGKGASARRWMFPPGGMAIVDTLRTATTA